MKRFICDIQSCKKDAEHIDLEMQIIDEGYVDTCFLHRELDLCQRCMTKIFTEHTYIIVDGSSYFLDGVSKVIKKEEKK